MSAHFAWLADHIEKNPDFIRPERYKNEALAMLRDESGLGDLCISRPKDRLSWGIELPFDGDYVCYVWFDALINYLTGAGYPNDPQFGRRWSSVEHCVAKDILKPHAIFWPIMLRVIGLPPYRHLNVHGYWNVDARKVSKTLGNMISPLVIQEKYGFEPFRFFLLRDMVFGLDSNFSEEALVARINSDLANNLGNLVSRTLNMTARYADARVPEAGPATALEDEVAAAVLQAAERVDEHMRRCEIHRALEAIFELVDVVNRYLEQRAPWKAAKVEGSEEQVATTLYTSCEALRCIAVLISPFLPATAQEISARLGIPDALDGEEPLAAVRRWGGLASGTPTIKGAALFPRIDPQDSGSS
jgi:methionyl-tRNA synthetase